MLIVISSLIVIGLILYIVFPPIKVYGDSMFPALKEGQILIGSRIFSRLNPEINGVYVIESPTDNKRLIKRLVRIDKRGLFFEGDNKSVSFDSRSFGAISRNRLVAKIISRRV